MLRDYDDRSVNVIRSAPLFVPDPAPLTRPQVFTTGTAVVGTVRPVAKSGGPASRRQVVVDPPVRTPFGEWRECWTDPDGTRRSRRVRTLDDDDAGLDDVALAQLLAAQREERPVAEWARQ